MNTGPLLDIIYLVAGLGIAGAWLREKLNRQAIRGPEEFWPGTTPVRISGILIIVAGVLLITIAETCVEIRAQVSQLQSVSTLYILGASLGAAIVEEMVFRGFLAPAGLQGKKLLLLIFLGSIIFSLFHALNGFNFRDTQGQISLAFAFLMSVWLYLGRYNPLNPERSLLPCLIGHLVRNLAVFGIKWSQGFVNLHS